MPNKVYFPHSDQFDQMNEHLKAIAAAVGSQVDLSNWTGIRKAVLSGIAKDIMPVGTLLTVNHSVYGNKPWAVLGHDHLPNPTTPVVTPCSSALCLCWVRCSSTRPKRSTTLRVSWRQVLIISPRWV